MSEASDNEEDTLEENYYSILNVGKVRIYSDRNLIFRLIDLRYM